MWRQKSWGSTKRKNLKIDLRFKHVQNAHDSIIIFIRQILLWTEQLFVTHVRALDNWTYSTFLSLTEELMAEAIQKVECVDFGNRSSILQNRENTQQKHVVSCGQVSGVIYCGGSEVVAVKLHPIRSVEGLRSIKGIFRISAKILHDSETYLWWSSRSMLSIKGNLRLYVGLPDCVDNFKNGVNNGVHCAPNCLFVLLA